MMQFRPHLMLLTAGALFTGAMVPRCIAAASVQPAVSQIQALSGNAPVYDDGAIRPHVLFPVDTRADVSYEGEKRLAVTWPPPFSAGLAVWEASAAGPGRPFERGFIGLHPAGASYLRGVSVRGTAGVVLAERRDRCCSIPVPPAAMPSWPGSGHRSRTDTPWR